MKDYDRQILQILSEVGQRGISVRTLSKHVYNMNCTLFEVPDMASLHAYVQQFLLRNSRSASPLVLRTERRGYYRLNPNSPTVRQTLLVFREDEEEEDKDEDVMPQQDLSLSLF